MFITCRRDKDVAETVDGLIEVSADSYHNY